MIVPQGNRERADSYLRIVSSRTADNMREFSAVRRLVSVYITPAIGSPAWPKYTGRLLGV